MEDEEKEGKKSGQSGTKRDVQWWKNMLHDAAHKITAGQRSLTAGKLRLTGKIF